jgi:RNA polymerase sigma factor (sigma-70 family)
MGIQVVVLSSKGFATMAQDSLQPNFAASQVDITPDLLKSAQAYLEHGRHGHAPSDGLIREWEMFYHSCEMAIRRFAIRCGAPSVADCSQDVWKTLIMKLPEFQIGPECESFSSWLYTLVRNRAVDQLRERTRHPMESLTNGVDQRTCKSDLDPAAEWDRQSLRSQVHQVLGELQKEIPEEDYRILYMHWIEGRPMSEIAAFLNLSSKQVWARHHRAKNKFRRLFERYTNKEPPVVSDPSSA